MSALNLRNVKREFSELNYRPDVCHPDLIDELLSILDITGLRQEYETVADNLDSRSLINIIKHVCTVCYSDSSNRDSNVDFLAFLAKIYTEYYGIDEAVKRTVSKCLKSCPEKLQQDLCAAISQRFISIMEREHSLGETEYFLKALNECCEDFPNSITECVEKVMAFFQLNLRKSYEVLVLENTPAQQISAIRCIHEGFRFFLSAYKKNVFPNTLNFSITLNECFMDLLDCDNLPMETLFNCCLSIVYSQMNDMPALECWRIGLDKISTRSDLVKLGFCVAILNRYSSEELRIIEPDNGKSICINLYNVIMETSNRNLNDSSILLSSSRVLFVLSKRLCSNKDIYLEKHQLECFISFLWTRMDHFLDGVRHLARDTMINMVKIKDEYILNEILERLSVCDTNSKAFFIVLATLSDKVGSESIIKYLPNIAENLINLLSSNNSAIHIFINLMLNYHSIAESKLWFDYWLRPLFSNTDKLDVKHFERIITKAVELDPDVLKHVHDLSIQNEFSLKIYLILFNIQKQNYLANNDNGEWINQATFETLKIALHNNDENIRFIAVNLIVDSKKKTQTFSNMELELMKYFITYNIKDDNSSVKQNNLSFVKKLLLRMKESQFSVTVRNNTALNSTVTKHYSEFLHWLSEFCFQNLFCDANYSRRNFSLESLRLIQTCLSPTGIIGLNQSKNISLLLNCIWDTFEQNKILSKDILTYKNQELIKLENTEIKDMLEKSKILASSTSPPDCITAGYLLEVVIFFNQNNNHEKYIHTILMNLMNDLKKEVELAEQSLILASGAGPMYGLIHTIRHILNTLDWQTLSLKNDWITFIENISTVCLKCEKLVSIVVNDSSPEGIIPMDDIVQDDCSVTSQMILLCCWRTTKESSLLLGDIVSIIATQETEFSNDLIKKICSCLTLLLSETKHRGAFEQIYVAYLKVCSTMWKSPTLHKVPLQYLEDVLTEIKTGLGEMFCVTRRSAGMPFIIQALICTNHDKRKIVNYTMETLITICENKNITEDLEIGVVHALNVLRALFRCTQLGDLVGPFVSRAINISIILFNSSSWPIRNSSTLLLSALVNRVFGVPRSSTEISWKNRMTGREFFQRYPELYDTFLKEFQKFSPMDMRPSLYPTLLILARLYPSVNENTDSIFQLASYIPYIFKCAQSPVMKTRMLAATSIAPQVTQNKLVEHLNITCHELLKKDLKENTIHGLLLQIFSLVQDLPKLLLDDLNKLVILTEDLLLEHDHFINHSYVVQEVFLRCITCLWLQLDDLQYNSIRQLYTLILKSVSKLIQPHAIGRSKYLESAVFFLFSVSIKAQKDFSTALYDIMKNELHCRTVFDTLNFILSEMPIEYCDHLEKLKNIKYWDRKVLVDQLMSNESLIELVCQQCAIRDSLIDIKFLVLSNFTAALLKYYEKYELFHIFILRLYLTERDTAITNGVLCVKEYLNYSKFLDEDIVESIVQLVDDVYDNNRSDVCKIACIDLIVDNYNLLINYFGDFKDSMDIFLFFKIWNIFIHYSEEDSEEVRNHVWRLVNKDTNHTKSFELLFGKFSEHFHKIPSVVLMALIYWSYLDIELPQYRQEGQVFDGGDTSAFKEHTIRQKLALATAVCLANGKPQSTNLETTRCIIDFITEEWITINPDVARKVDLIKTVGDFMKYAEELYSKTVVPWNICPGFKPKNTRSICQ